MTIELPEKLLFFLTDKKRYKVAYGGRGSAKSWTVARCLILNAIKSKVRILCTRQLQTSIKDSVHKLLCDSINDLKLNEYFNITRDAITCINGSEFIFKGLQNQTNEIKSMEGINFCWCEEAQSISEDSWQILIPTIRKEGSEIWITFNPDREEDATYQRFVKNTPPNSIIELVNYYENLVKKYSKIVSPLKKITPHKLRSTFGTALYQETGDIYLAGGIVMTQAILVVIGILFSDIALAFLDPRIRYSGGGR